MENPNQTTQEPKQDFIDQNKEITFYQEDFQENLSIEEPDSSPEMPPKKKHKGGRRKIDIEFIQDKSKRHITFSKRKGGIMKKAYELSTLTGTQIIVLVASETGHVYTFATPKLQPIITHPEGKALIQTCLNQQEYCQQDPSTILQQEQLYYNQYGQQIEYDPRYVFATQSTPQVLGQSSFPTSNGNQETISKDGKFIS
jgi:pheromone receptor transcription factor